MTARRSKQKPQPPAVEAERSPSPVQSKGWIDDRWPMLLFAIKFLALLAFFYALSYLPAFQHFLPRYLHAIAWMASRLAHLCGAANEITDTTLRSSTWAMTVAPECSGTEFVWFIGAVVFAYPAGWLARVWGLVLGVIFVTLLNVVRVASLFLIGVHARVAFDMAHEQIWSLLLIVSTTVFVGVWIARLATGSLPSPKEKPAAA